MTDEVMKINANGVLTIPAKFRKAGFDANSLVNVALEEDGSLRVTPVEAIPKNQLGFHTTSWIKKERKATRDLKSGRIKSYKDRTTFLETLKKW